MIVVNTRTLGSPLAYARAEAKTVMADRGLLVTDTVLATFVPILLQVAIWTSLFAAGVAVDLTYKELISYYVFVVCLSRINNGYDIVERFSEAMHQGALEPHLMKPLPYWLQALAGFLGGSVVYLVVLAAALIFDIMWRDWPHHLSPVELTVFALSVTAVLLLSQVLTFFVSFVVGLLAFRVVRPELSTSLLILLQTVLGGTLLPPDLWGEPLRGLMTYNPFAFMLAAPAELISSREAAVALPAVAFGSVYTVGFAAISWLTWRYMIRRYHGAGG